MLVNYEKDTCEVIKFGYNANKMKTFITKYFETYEIKWFAIFDDSIRPQIIQDYKNERLMMIGRPSQNNEKDLQWDNSMCFSTLTYGFDGILECLDSYLSSIKGLGTNEILERQKDILPSLSIEELLSFLPNKNYDLLVDYLEKHLLNDSDYSIIGSKIGQILEEKNYKQEELMWLKKIMEIVCSKLTTENGVVAKYKSFINKHCVDF